MILALPRTGPSRRCRLHVLDAAVVEVLVELRLVDRVHRADAHRHRRELPEVGQETRVRVRRQAAALVRLLLAEAVELILGQAALEEGAGVHAGGGVALVEDVVAAAGMVLAAEEVVEAHFVESRRGGVGGDVAADLDAWTLGPVDEHGRVPAVPGAVLALELLVAGELGLVLGGDRVDVVRRGDLRHVEMQLTGAIEQARHDLPAAACAALLDDRVERFAPLSSLLGIQVVAVGRVRILRVHSQDCAPFTMRRAVCDRVVVRRARHKRSRRYAGYLHTIEYPRGINGNCGSQCSHRTTFGAGSPCPRGAAFGTLILSESYRSARSGKGETHGHRRWRRGARFHPVRPEW